MARGRKKGSKLVEGKIIEAVNNTLPDNITVGLGEGLKIDEEASEGFKQINPEEVKSIESTSDFSGIDWDFTIYDQIEYFQSDKSYELTKYRPIDETHGLDFNPSWFTEVRDIKESTGYYTQYRPGTKAHRDFWSEQYRRCRDGYESHGYRITGDNYFFLNFYRLKTTSKKEIEKIFHLLYDNSHFYLSRKFKKFNYYVNTEVNQLIADHRNAQEVNVNESNNLPKSAEHLEINENVR